MADAAVSKTAEGNLVRVRLPLSAPSVRIQIDRILLSKVPHGRYLGGRLTAVLTAVEAGPTQLSSSLLPGLGQSAGSPDPRFGWLASGLRFVMGRDWYPASIPGPLHTKAPEPLRRLTEAHYEVWGSKSRPASRRSLWREVSDR